MFYIIMKSRSRHNSTKKALWFRLLWRYGLLSSITHPTCFPSRNITKNADTNPPPMRDVIIEQPLRIMAGRLCNK